MKQISDNKRRIFVDCSLLAVLVVLDQITKLIFSHRDFFVGMLHIHPMRNYGLSFSLNFGPIVNFALVGLGLLVFVYYFFKHRQNFPDNQQFWFVLIFAGAISNIIDRIYLGYVRDFLDLGLGFTFNFADVFVLAGLIFLLTAPKNGDKLVK